MKQNQNFIYQNDDMRNQNDMNAYFYFWKKIQTELKTHLLDFSPIWFKNAHLQDTVSYN